MEKRYIIALTTEQLDVSVQQEVCASRTSSTLPPPLGQVVIPRLAKHVAEKYPDFQVICGSSSADLAKQKTLVEKAEIIFMLDAPAIILAHVIPFAPNLRWIHSFFAGVDGICSQLKQLRSIDEPGMSMTQNNLLVTNAKGVFSSSLKEYVIAAILYFAKQVPRLEKNKQDKKWERFIMGEIKGLTVGFVGYGDIAREIALACKFFGMRCIATRKDPSKKGGHLDALYGADTEEQLEVYKQADFVVCSLPGTPHTENNVSTEQFAAMKDSGVFISIGRGSVVDEAALLDALKSGKIAGAALDVFRMEPLPPDSPFWEAPNVLLSSHNADLCENYSVDAAIRVFDENMDRYLAGATTNADMATPIDLEKGY